MRTSRKVAIGVAALAIGALAVPLAASAGSDSEVPITGPALEKASAAAIEHLGEGRVTDTEVGDEESYYEVEVTLDDGREVDVQLDESFNVVGSETDGPQDANDTD